MKTYTTVNDEQATVVHVEARMLVDQYKEATKMAKALGYKSLKAYLNHKVMDLVDWKLPQEYTDAGFEIE
jgi:hypothetical protein